MNGLLKTGEDMFGMTHAFDEGGDRISNDRPALSIDDWASKMRHLVAAWNACAGIPTEELEKLPLEREFQTAVELIEAHEARANEAVRLLEEALVCLTTTFRDCGKRHDAAIAAIRAFLEDK